jgi:hypothetical protein
MEFGTMMVLLAGIGSVTGIVAMVIDKRASARDKQFSVERVLAEQRLELQAQRIAELERHNDQLEAEIAWHRRLAEAKGDPARTLDAPADSKPSLAR